MITNNQKHPKTLPPGSCMQDCTRCSTKYLSYKKKPGICDGALCFSKWQEKKVALEKHLKKTNQKTLAEVLEE